MKMREDVFEALEYVSLKNDEILVEVLRSMRDLCTTYFAVNATVEEA
jgi:hypothetical protein